jgi:hypothetical protein
VERIKRFSQIVVWGLHDVYHSHRYVYEAYFRAFSDAFGTGTFWVNDTESSVSLINPNALIFAWAGACEHLPLRNDCFYVYHGQLFHIPEIDLENKLYLMAYQNLPNDPDFIKFDECCYYNEPYQVLYQPWGTNLKSDEFYEPICNINSNIVNWVGSIWMDNKDPLGGNIKAIDDLKLALKRHNIDFAQKIKVSNEDNASFVRASRIAPAIAGERHVCDNCLPCRMFKNISYGQLGFSNVEHFNHVYKDCNIYDSNIESLVDKVMGLTESQYIGVIKEQQEITKRYTYDENVKRILSAIDIIKGGK